MLSIRVNLCTKTLRNCLNFVFVSYFERIKFSDEPKLMRIASLFKEILQKYEGLSRQNKPKDKT